MTGVPIGILITQSKTAADRVLYAAAIIMTIPSIALFGVLIPILSLIGQGIGYLPAVIALILYAQLPIIRNTYTAIMNVDPALREASRGMGMTHAAAAAAGRTAARAAGHHQRRAQRGGAEHRDRRDRDLYRRRRARHLHLPRHLADRHPRSCSPARSSVSLLAIIADFALLGRAARCSPRPA